MIRIALIGAAVVTVCTAGLPLSAHAGPTLAEAIALDRGEPAAVGAGSPTPVVEAAWAGTSLRTLHPWLVAPVQGGLSGARFALPLVDDDTWSLRLGAGLRRDAPRALQFEGSEAAWRLDASEVYASVQRRHWGPGHVGSLILDGAAEPVPAVGWRRERPQASESVWLRWLGPWTGDLFVGRLTEHQEPERPWLIGMRLEAQPWPQLRFGLSRTLQWGGRGRPEGMRSLLRALGGSDNADGTTDSEPGNQLAGLDWRWTLWPRHDLAWYGQVIGEDEAGKLPSHNFSLTGLEARHRLDGGATLRAFVEWTDTLAGSLSDDPLPGVTYRHHIYRQGYTQDGLLLGHPIGGDAELTSVGLLFDGGPLTATLVAGRGRARATAQRFSPGRLELVNAALQLEAGGGHRAGLGLWWLKSADGQNATAQAWWQYAWQ